MERVEAKQTSVFLLAFICVLSRIDFSASLDNALSEAYVEQEQLNNIVEAALLAAQQPLTLPMLAALFHEEDGVGHEHLARSIEALTQACEGRGVELVEVGSGFRYQVREAVHPWVARLWAERQTKYSRALLETLALIAYRQPITRGEIEQVRGVAVATSIMRTLEEREWVRVVGYRDVPGKPALFGTTRQFLDYFNLKSLDQLPTLAEIREIADPDPQLALAATADPVAGEESDASAADSAEDDSVSVHPTDTTDADAPADGPRTTEDAA
jgi:segregation and condensation protein B